MCSGIGGLDLGLRIALPQSRVLCYVEREISAVEVLVARIADRALDDAPVWGAIETFDGRPWHRAVDIVVAGYPCAPFSLARRRRTCAAHTDEKYLWPQVLRIVEETEPIWCFFENVEQHKNTGLDAVVGDLEDRGFVIEWDIFSAAEHGASHIRKRIFILAARGGRPLDDADEQRLEEPPRGEGQRSPQGLHEAAFRTGRLWAWPPTCQEAARWRLAGEHCPGLEPAVCRMADGPSGQVTEAETGIDLSASNYWATLWCRRLRRMHFYS